jgi:hypothetical protein
MDDDVLDDGMAGYLALANACAMYYVTTAALYHSSGNEHGWAAALE